MARTTNLYGRRESTNKENEIIKLVAQGLTNKEVAQRLNISKGTVRNYIHVIYDKTGTWNRAELTVWYLQRQVN